MLFISLIVLLIKGLKISLLILIGNLIKLIL